MFGGSRVARTAWCMPPKVGDSTHFLQDLSCISILVTTPNLRL